MLFLKYMLMVMGSGMLTTAGVIVANDMWLVSRYHKKLASNALAVEPEPVRWRATVALVCLAWAPLLIGISLVVPRSTSHMPRAPRIANVEYSIASLRH